MIRVSTPSRPKLNSSGNSRKVRQLDIRGTEPAIGFGSGDREHSARCYVSELHSKSTAGVYGSSPGPAYRPVSSMGNQATSRGTTAPQWGFGKANRFKGLCDNGIPGPGAYAI